MVYFGYQAVFPAGTASRLSLQALPSAAGIPKTGTHHLDSVRDPEFSFA